MGPFFDLERLSSRTGGGRLGGIPTRKSAPEEADHVPGRVTDRVASRPPSETPSYRPNHGV